MRHHQMMTMNPKCSNVHHGGVVVVAAAVADGSVSVGDELCDELCEKYANMVVTTLKSVSIPHQHKIGCTIITCCKQCMR